MSDILGDWKKTHFCGELRKEDIGKEVCLMGWVHRRRDHGGLIFIDLRDRTGIGQLALDPDRDPEAHTKAEAIRNEFVVAAIGKVSPRPEGTVNPKMPTGKVEVVARELIILNESRTPPFTIEDDINELLEGVEVSQINEDQAKEYRIPLNVTGLIITSVSAESPYARNLTEGMVIMEVNDEEVTTIREAREQLKSGVNKLYIYNRGRTGYLPIRVE